MTTPSEVDTFDLASLEAFTAELVQFGFEPEPDTARRFWTGPTHAAFAPLTDANTMRIYIRDGWPAVSPVLFLDGLHTNHLTRDGYVCLWHDDDGSRQWLTVAGLNERIEAWCHDAQHGWDPAGLAHDALLNFRPKSATVATFDLDALRLRGPGTWQPFHGELRHQGHVELKPGNAQGGQLNGVAYRLGPLSVPPRSLDETLEILHQSQRRNLERALARRQPSDLLEPSGSIDIILLCWDRDTRHDVLVLGLDSTKEPAEAIALQPGPNDPESLLLRAGPDAKILQPQGVAVFGLGALGGGVALILADSGIGRLHLVDADVLLPGNVVRHIQGHHAVGFAKVDAVKHLILDHTPWIDITVTRASPITPTALNSIAADHDLIVDCTGNAAATAALSATATLARRPLISGALYRGGAVARVQRQGTGDDEPIPGREPSPEHLAIPPADESEFIEPQAGCSSPVINAPPTSVIAASALVAQAAIDVLTGRRELPDEIIDVYRALPGQPPFERLGRIRPE